MDRPERETVDYPLNPALRARLMGALLLLVGVVLCVGAAVVFAADWPRDLLSGLVLAVPVVVAGGGYLLTRRSWVVRATADGYVVRFVRGAGRRSARWMDVQDVVASTVAGARCVMIRLRDGSSTTIPVGLLAMRDDDFVRDLQGHLDRANGYRR